MGLSVRRQLAACGLVTVAAAAAPLVARPLLAQSSECASAAVQLQDGCQKTVDFFGFLAPQLATAVAGGNAVLGQGSTLGGLGHFTVGVQANVVKGAVPKFDQTTVSTGGTQQTDFATTTVPLPMPSVVVGVGLFGGFPLGITRVGGLDVLGSAIYVPSYTGNSISIKPKNSIQFGYGGRLGIVSETPLTPGVSVSIMERDLPKTTLTGTDGNQDTLTVGNLSVKTTSWRIVASKNLLFIGLAAGVGADHYYLATDVHVALSPTTSVFCLGGGCAGTVASPEVNITRTNYFGDLSFNMSVVRIVVEVGQVAGKTVPTVNTFSGKQAGDSRLYGSVGFLLKI